MPRPPRSRARPRRHAAPTTPAPTARTAPTTRSPGATSDPRSSSPGRAPAGRRPPAQLRARRVDQALREQARGAGRTSRTSSGSATGDRRLDDRQLLRRERADLHEPAVGRQRGADEHRPRVAARGEIGALLQRGVARRDHRRGAAPRPGARRGRRARRRAARARRSARARRGTTSRLRSVRGARARGRRPPWPNASRRRGDRRARSGGRAARPSSAASSSASVASARAARSCSRRRRSGGSSEYSASATSACVNRIARRRRIDRRPASPTRFAASRARSTTAASRSTSAASTSSSNSMPSTAPADEHRPRSRARARRRGSTRRRAGSAGSSRSDRSPDEADRVDVALDQTGLDPVPDELRRVQRVAGRVVAQSRRDRGRARAGLDRHEVGEVGVVEAAQRDALRVAPVEVGEHEPQLVGHVLGAVAKAHDQQHRGVDQRAREVTQQRQRGRLRPVQVVEHHDERRRRRRSGAAGPRRPRRAGSARSRRRSRSVREPRCAPRAAARCAGARRRTAPRALRAARSRRARRTSRARLRNGCNGTAAPSSQRAYSTVLAGRSCTSAANAASSVVLPMPASPLRHTVCSPDLATASRARRASAARTPARSAGPACASAPGSGMSTATVSQLVAMRCSISRTSADGSVPTSSASSARYCWNTRNASAWRPSPASASIKQAARPVAERIRPRCAPRAGRPRRTSGTPRSTRRPDPRSPTRAAR